MQKITFLLLAFVAMVHVIAQPTKATAETIRKYCFARLEQVPQQSQDAATATRLQGAHMANINRLYL